jgi:broad specificity phosphatase PhoE
MTLTIKLVRHGESEANLRYELAREIGDQNVPLTERGREQARLAGREIGPDFMRGALLYCSPYRRARDTLDELLVGAGLAPTEPHALRRYEDPRLREVEHGYEDVAEQEALRRTHGWFYYRYRGGESPADCFDRTSGFLETLMRQVDRKSAERVLIVTHGLTIRCFVMRFLHLSVEEFCSIANPQNADVITIEWGANPDAYFTTGRWSVLGLRRRPEDDL